MAKVTDPSERKALITTNTAVDTSRRASTAIEDRWRWQRKQSMAKDGLVGSALEALQSNRLRSFLTILGVIIGVSAVIAVVTLAQGVSQSVSSRFAGLGVNVITISPGTASTTGAREAIGSAQTLTLADAQAVGQLPHVLNMSPLLTTSAQVVAGSENWNTSVHGVYPDYQTIDSWSIAQGAWFSDQDEQLGNPVAVLGQTVVQNLFPAGTNPIGQTILINNQTFRVIGTLQAKGSSGFSNQDDVIFVPFSAANQRLKPSPIYVDQIQVQVDNPNNVSVVEQSITTLLRQRHNLPGPAPTSQSGTFTGASNPLSGLGSGSGSRTIGSGGGRFGGGGNFGGRTQTGGQQSNGTTSPNSTGNPSSATGAGVPNDFQVFSGDQLVQTAQQNTTELTILLVGIAAISLTVGGIGIMNIMLVSVSERTREIGIRMAVGARQRDIRNQFLLEALLLSIIGGIVGIILGFIVGFALTHGFSLPFVVSPIAVVLAFGVSAVVGIVFGFYPAVHAAKLDPILALHTE
ncbi:MAG TPA: ABC transporter permease [Ktedonobacteraceae bacterium]|nr:ABC transporter permease [Ktedonobacteraceae bacterium]